MKGKSIDENIDEFTKLVVDLESLCVKIEDEDQAVILLNSLPKVFDQLRDTLKYSKDLLSLEGVVSAIHAKKMDIRVERINTTSSEGLVVRGRPKKRNNNQKGNHDKSKSKSKSKSKFTRKCFHCHKEGHYREFVDVAIAFEGYDIVDVLMVAKKDLTSEWILDSGYKGFHMCPIKSWFSRYMELKEGKVLMGHNEACKVFGIGSIKLWLHDAMERTLTNVRYV